MAEDDSQPGPDTTVQLESHEIEEIEELPEFPDREEFVQTLEMDSATRNAMTRPTESLPDQTTERYDVPDQLLEAARRTQITDSEAVEAHGSDAWREFVAVVDKKGRISLPSSVHRGLRGKKIKVRFKVQED